MQELDEVWQQVQGYENLYWVSSLGNVKSKRKILKPIITKGYQKVHLSKEGIKHKVFIHRLVAQAFIPNPENKPQVNHIDGNKQNNLVSNLLWATSLENTLHQHQTGLVQVPKGANHHSYKGDIQVIDPQTGNIISILHGELDIKNQGFNPSCIYQVLSGRAKTHKGLTFKRIYE